MTLDRSITFIPARDDRPAGGGISGVGIHFLVKGPAGAVGWEIMTPWSLPHVVKEHRAKFGFGHPPMGAVAGPVTTHRLTPEREGREAMDCEYVAAGKCFTDAWFLGGEKAMDALAVGGEPGIWKFLEGHYRQEFAVEGEKHAER